VADRHLTKRVRARGLPWLLLLELSTRPGQAVDFGGSLALTSDYIYHGVSESDGRAAAQADVHADDGGTFLGVWGSMRDNSLDPYADYDVEIYLGHRFDLSSTWSAALSARGHYFVGGNQDEGSADYQEITASLTYLDRWTLSASVIPNAVHYWYEEHLSRSPAWIADTTGQWLVYAAGLFVTGGAGYYYATRTGPGIAAGGGYAYGNAGLAFERGRWRVDVGYFLTQSKARLLLPYPIPADRVAGTLIWRF